MPPSETATIRAVPEAQWAATIAQSLSQFGHLTQVTPPEAIPASDEAEIVVWGAGAEAFCCQKIRGPVPMDLAASIHNPNYPGDRNEA